MFWINGQHLMRARMDGSGSIPLRSLSSSEEMQQLKLDINQERLYWINRGNGQVESVDYSGGQHQSISSSMGSPASLAFHGRFVFWVDSARKKLVRAWKVDGQNVVDLYEEQDDSGPRRLALVSSGRPGGRNTSSHCAVTCK